MAESNIVRLVYHYPTTDEPQVAHFSQWVHEDDKATIETYALRESFQPEHIKVLLGWETKRIDNDAVKLKDIVDKCNDVLEKCDDILEALP